LEQEYEDLDEDDEKTKIDWERFEVRKKQTAEEKEEEKLYK
jgi:hypothetical protein